MLVAVPLTIGSAVALASIPDSGTGVFHGCVNKTSGALRLIDRSKGAVCTATESSVAWDQTGISWRGSWSSTVAYRVNDAVEYQGSSFLARVANTAVAPTNATDWATLAGAGAAGPKGPTGPKGSAGANGRTVLNGSGAPSDLVGTTGDFYIDTASKLIYGPAVSHCTLQRGCLTTRGSGTSLVGPAGQGVVYDTYAGDNRWAGGIDVPNGASTRVLTQTLPRGGDYSVTANLVLEHDGGNSSWKCDLVAANPGGAQVVLDTTYAIATTDDTPASLEGVVSIAAGGIVGINCYEWYAQKNDDVVAPQIMSTLVSNLSILPPG
jgi:hypothetical protein